MRNVGVDKVSQLLLILNKDSASLCSYNFICDMAYLRMLNLQNGFTEVNKN